MRRRKRTECVSLLNLKGGKSIWPEQIRSNRRLVRVWFGSVSLTDAACVYVIIIYAVVYWRLLIVVQVVVIESCSSRDGGRVEREEDVLGLQLIYYPSTSIWTDN
jgi:hypothetical protein